jgi:hypothetical protein
VFEILIDNKNGNVWDISNIVSGVKWKTSRIGRPGSLEFTLIKNAIYQDVRFQFNNGDIIRFRKDGQNIFYGYTFVIDGGKDEAVKILAYDQVRYLLSSDTYVFANITASDILRKIAADFNLRLGQIDDTIYRIPTMVEDGKKLLDIVCKSLDLTLINSNRNFVLYDDFGSLRIRNIADMLVDFIIGDGSLMYDFNMKTSIDHDTYNKVKLYKDNKDTGKREVYIAQDSANKKRWGTLQLYQSVDENMNAAQIKQLLDTLITLKNRESKTLKINAIGDVRIRAGSYVRILIEEYNINQPFLVDECQHSFDGSDHTMTLEMKVVG